MNGVNWLELFLALVGLIGWCIMVLKLVDGWANRQYQHRMNEISAARTQEMNSQLLDKLQSNLEAAERIHYMLDRRLLLIDVRLENLLAHKRIISTWEPPGRGRRGSIRELDAMESYEGPENHGGQTELPKRCANRF